MLRTQLVIIEHMRRNLFWIALSICLAFLVVFLVTSLIGNAVKPEMNFLMGDSVPFRGEVDPGTHTLSKTPTSTRTSLAIGPLSVHPTNGRYFTNGDGQALLLTGSHTWSNFQDNGGSDPPAPFDYSSFLDFLVENNHNFFRLWTWEEARWTVETNDNNYWFYPEPPFQRTGPGNAQDGKPRFDLTKFNQDYFERLRERIIEARNRGIYVSIMLFDGWSVSYPKGGFGENNPWNGHPFKNTNNTNGINGDPNGDNSGDETHELAVQDITSIQEAYVKKVIDSVNDLDNVLYEISNESNGNSQEWQYHMIDLIRNYEENKSKQHPIGMTVEWPGGDNDVLLNSTADWISPNGDINNPPPTDGSKVIILDSDHLCGVCGDREFVWKGFTRGHNPIYMDPYDGAGYGVGAPSGWQFNDPTALSIRENMGYALSYANRMNLAAMTPRGDLCSTDYCLANPSASSAEYLVYQPHDSGFSVDLSGTSGQLLVEWLNPETGEIFDTGSVPGGGNRNFSAPFSGDSVLYLYHDSSFVPSHFGYLPLISQKAGGVQEVKTDQELGGCSK